MLHISICDDDPIALSHIHEIIEQWSMEKNKTIQISIFTNGEELLNFCTINLELVDIILLDIRMENMDGMETAKKLRSLSKEILLIFVTAYWENVYQSFRIHTFRYILKKEMHITLPEAIEEAAIELEDGEIFFAYLCSRKKIKVRCKDIIYFESSLRKVYIQINGESGRRIFYEQLIDIQCRLDGENFIRCHQSFIINSKFIQELDQNRLILKHCPIRIPVSNKYHNSVEKYRLWNQR